MILIKQNINGIITCIYMHSEKTHILTLTVTQLKNRKMSHPKHRPRSSKIHGTNSALLKVTHSWVWAGVARKSQKQGISICTWRQLGLPGGRQEQVAIGRQAWERTGRQQDLKGRLTRDQTSLEQAEQKCGKVMRNIEDNQGMSVWAPGS